jgi:MFS family permease
MMGIGRLLFGCFGKNIDLRKVILGGFALSTVCYLVISFVHIHAISLTCSALTGLGVSLLWPGTLSIAAGYFPLAGNWIFAILAASGDIGGAFGPWIVGLIVDWAGINPYLLEFGNKQNLNSEQVSLKIGIGFGAIFPFIGFVFALILLFKGEKKQILTDIDFDSNSDKSTET